MMRLRDWLRTSLWFIPLCFVIGAVGLWLALHALDEALAGEDLPIGFGGGPGAAQSVLSAITTSMITFTGVVFSVTIVALQLASTQFSPRVLRNFMRDRRTQVTLGVFVATFVYAILVLRDVRLAGGSDDAYVPRVSTTVALLVLGASLVAFVVFVHHIAQSIRASRVVLAVGREARESIDQLVPATRVPAPLVTAPDLRGAVRSSVCAPRPGYVTACNRAALVEAGRRCAGEVHVLVRPGDFVVEGGALLRFVAPTRIDAEERSRAAAAIAIGPERTPTQDLMLPFRSLVDVALRALSPSLNDPTTAVQSLDQIHDLLRRIAPRPAPPSVGWDDDGIRRLVEPSFDWDGLVDLCFTEIVAAGRDQVQVVRRLDTMLRDLLDVAPPERQRTLRRQLGAVFGACASPVPAA